MSGQPAQPGQHGQGPPLASGVSRVSPSPHGSLALRVGEFVLLKTAQEPPQYTLHVLCELRANDGVVVEYDPDAGAGATPPPRTVSWSHVYLPCAPASMAVSEQQVFALSMTNSTSDAASSRSAMDDAPPSSAFTTVYFPSAIVGWRPSNRFALRFVDGEEQVLPAAITFNRRSVPTVVQPVRVYPSLVDASIRAGASSTARSPSTTLTSPSSSAASPLPSPGLAKLSPAPPPTSSPVALKPPASPSHHDPLVSHPSPTIVSPAASSAATARPPPHPTSASSTNTSAASANTNATLAAPPASSSSTRKKRSFMIAFPVNPPAHELLHAPAFQPVDPSERVLLDVVADSTDPQQQPSVPSIPSRIGFVTSRGCQHRWDKSRTYPSKQITVAPFALKFSF